MTDAIVTVADAADLETPGPSDRERQAIAAFLSAGAPAVVWVPEWLLEDKGIQTAKGYYQLAIGDVEPYTDKALSFKQPATGRDAPVYLPISETAAFKLADGVDEVETPQAGLADFER